MCIDNYTQVSACTQHGSKLCMCSLTQEQSKVKPIRKCPLKETRQSVLSNGRRGLGNLFENIVCAISQGPQQLHTSL